MQKPRRLMAGDEVAVVSLSRGMLGEPAFIHKYELARERLEALGLRVRPMPNALKGIEYLDRHPEKRAEDLMAAFRDPSIKAVFNAIGGDDSIRMLPYIDFDVLRSNPKIFSGFSDTTVSHFMMHKAGLVSYYGLSLMNNWAEYVKINEYTQAFIDNILFHPTESFPIPPSDFCSHETVWWKEENKNTPIPREKAEGYRLLQGKGKVRGTLLGGCIDVFTDLLGTSLFPPAEEWEGKLLLLEHSEWDMSENLLRSLLRNLMTQGIFEKIRGLVIGRPAVKEKVEIYPAVYKRVIAEEAGLPELPILYNVNVGHAYPIGIFPLGLTYELDCDTPSLTLMEPATL